MGFNFIGVLMDELVTAAATIHAAQIQANYALWAAVVSAIIGALGIIFAAWYAWQSGMRLHQYNNIIEAKRDVYLDSIAKFQQIKSDLKLITVKPINFSEILINDRKDFLISINKVQIICDTSNKDIVLNFKTNIEDRLKKIITISDIYIKDHLLLIKEQEELTLLNYEQDKFLEEADYLKIFHAEHYRKVANLKSKIEKCRENLKLVTISCDYHLKLMNENIESFEKDLVNEYNMFSSILRDELHKKISK